MKYRDLINSFEPKEINGIDNKPVGIIVENSSNHVFGQKDYIDYGSPRLNELMNKPDGLPEYSQKARAAIIEALGYYPIEQAGHEMTIRNIIYSMEQAGKWDKEFLDTAIKDIFCPRYTLTQDDNITVN